MTKRRVKRKSFSLNEYPKGRGKMLCQYCFKPIRDHEIGACPEAPRGEFRMEVRGRWA